jgi:cellulose synthase/poly-beta-1,6-N-acetylglucosamine synthase-like glycosyltransferase/transposase
MPVKLNTQERLEIVKKIESGEPVAKVCREAGISRTLCYRWLARYKALKIPESLEVKKRRPASHPKTVSSKTTNLILRVVQAHPEYSSAKISKALPKTDDGAPLAGNHGVQRVLERLNLNTFESRSEFASKQKELRGAILSPTEKLRIIERVLGGEKVAKVCREAGVSRTICYKWLARVKEVGGEAREGLLEVKRGRPERWARQASSEVEQLVLSIVAKHPELSAHKIGGVLPEIEGKKPIGHHGIQNILMRYGLNTYEKRWAYSQTHRPRIVPSYIPRAWGQSLKLLRFAIAPFATVPKLAGEFAALPYYLPVILFSFTAFFGLFAYIRYLFSFPEESRIGLTFASIALFFGSIFFLYSLKYYSSLVLVLRLSSQAPEAGEAKVKKGIGKQKNGHLSNLANRFFSLIKRNGVDGKKGKNGANGVSSSIIPNLGEVELGKKPFVSIQIPFYNEKRVAERIITALMSLSYPKDNYEVVVIDDSTDETTDIVRMLEKEHKNLKLVHRETRSGFKGAALSKALEVMNPRTEYVMVFDADFIPYPDTIEQFLKNFAVNCDGLDKVAESKIAAIQGYQWHVLNKSENWITRGVRTEYAGSYVIERTSTQIYGGLEQIAGSVYMIRADLLKKLGWGTSITEDFQLTLKLYEAGYKVIYTPYIQAPAEAVSTIKRLVRQRMRWAEGHTYNIKHMFRRIIKSSALTFKEKIEFAYLSPYYLQAVFLTLGTVSWFIAEAFLQTRLPFWTSLWGWSLLFTNLLSLPLMNISGLFLEESEERDYLGIGSFLVLSYILVPFQGYAAIKGLFEKEEGPWFRTPKTGHITDVFAPGRFARWVRTLFPGKGGVAALSPEAVDLSPYVALATANNKFDSFTIRPGRARWLSKSFLAALLIVTVFVGAMTSFVPHAEADNPTGPFYLSNNDSSVVSSTASWQLLDNSLDSPSDSTTQVDVARNGPTPRAFQYQPGSTNSTAVNNSTCSSLSYTSGNGAGWIFDTAFGGGGSIASGDWTFHIYESDNASAAAGGAIICVWAVTITSSQINAGGTLLVSIEDTTPSTNLLDNAVSNVSYTSSGESQKNMSSGEYIYVEYWLYVTDRPSANSASNFYTGDITGEDPRIIMPSITIPELAGAFLFSAPFVPVVVYLWMRRKEKIVPSFNFLRGGIRA